MMNIASTPSSPPSHDAREVSRSPLRAWLTPALLLALATVPSLVGVVRLVGLAAGGASSPDNVRLDAHPVPLALHIAGSTGFAVLGALQFAPHLQRRRWHRVAGRLSVILGVAGALAAMWLAIEVPASADDAPWLRGPRFAAGAGMLAYLLAGFAAGRRDVATHRAWMTRAYALALGGGTQVFTAAPYLFLCKSRSPTIYSLLLVAGWVINLAVAEWVLFAERSRRVRRAATTTLAAALVLLAARPAHAEDRARVGALLETAAEAAHDGRVRSSAEALSAGVLFAGAGVASWVTTSAPEDRSARDVVGGVLVGVGGALILGSTYTLVAPSDLERQSGAWVEELRTAGPEATDAIVREADRMLVARARAAKTERVAEGVAAFVFAALEIGGGLVLQARSDDPGLVWLGRGLVAGAWQEARARASSESPISPCARRKSASSRRGNANVRSPNRRAEPRRASASPRNWASAPSVSSVPSEQLLNAFRPREVRGRGSPQDRDPTTSRPHDIATPRHHDTTTPRHHDTSLPLTEVEPPRDAPACCLLPAAGSRGRRHFRWRK